MAPRPQRPRGDLLDQQTAQDRRLRSLELGVTGRRSSPAPVVTGATSVPPIQWYDLPAPNPAYATYSTEDPPQAGPVPPLKANGFSDLIALRGTVTFSADNNQFELTVAILPGVGSPDIAVPFFTRGIRQWADGSVYPSLRGVVTSGVGGSPELRFMAIGDAGDTLPASLNGVIVYLGGIQVAVRGA